MAVYLSLVPVFLPAAVGEAAEAVERSEQRLKQNAEAFGSMFTPLTNFFLSLGPLEWVLTVVVAVALLFVIRAALTLWKDGQRY